MKSVLTTSAALAIAFASTAVTRTGDGSSLVESENVDVTAKLLQIQSTGPEHVASYDEDLAAELKALDAEVTNFTYDGQVAGSVEDVQARMKLNIGRIAGIAVRKRGSILANYGDIMDTASTADVTSIGSTETPQAVAAA